MVLLCLNWLSHRWFAMYIIRESDACWWIKLYTFTGLLLLSSLISMESNLYVLLNISESRASCYIFPYHPELLIFHWTMKKGGLQFTVLCRWSICVRKLWLFCIRISVVSVFFFFANEKGMEGADQTWRPAPTTLFFSSFCLPLLHIDHSLTTVFLLTTYWYVLICLVQVG